MINRIGKLEEFQHFLPSTLLSNKYKIDVYFYAHKQIKDQKFIVVENFRRYFSLLFMRN